MSDSVRQQFKKRLAEILENPRIEANRLHSLPDCCKIKLRRAGYRLVCRVLDHEAVVFVAAGDRREGSAACRKVAERFSQDVSGCRQAAPASRLS